MRHIAPNALQAIGITAIILLGGMLFHQGVKEDYYLYFAIASLIGPAVLVGRSKQSLQKDVIQAAILTLAIILIAKLFWDYQDKPWFSPPEDESCDGPCYGWFSFENQLRIVPLLTMGCASSVVGLAIKKIRHRS